MRCFANTLFAVLLLAGGPLRAQDAGDAVRPAGAPAGLAIAEAVAQAVAARWGVAAARVRVEPSPPAQWPAAADAVRLLGDGQDGTWIVACTAAGVEKRLLVRAGVLATVQVAAHDLERGATLSAADMRLDSELQWGPPRTTTEPVSGWTVKRRISAGEPLRSPAVEPPLAVRPGDTVQLIVTRGQVTITLSGRAAGAAPLGGRVSVRAATGRLLEGTVIAPGVVRQGPASADHAGNEGGRGNLREDT